MPNLACWSFPLRRWWVESDCGGQLWVVSGYGGQWWVVSGAQVWRWVGTAWEAGWVEPASSNNQSRRFTSLGNSNDKFQLHCFECCEMSQTTPIKLQTWCNNLWALVIANFLTNQRNRQFFWTFDGSIAMIRYYIYNLMFWGWLVSISSLSQLFRKWSGLMLFIVHIGSYHPSKVHSWEYVDGGLWVMGGTRYISE